MNRKQQTFINEVLRHGDKTKAYKTAYPTAKDSSIPAAVSRLMKDPEVDEILNGNLQRMRAELEAEMREKLKEEIAGELELKVSLTRIIRGQTILPRKIRTKDGEVMMDQYVGFAQLIRAIVELAKMEGLYERATSGERRAEEKKRQEEEKAEQKRREREEKNRQDAIWEKAMHEKFNTQFKGYTHIDIQDHYKALGDYDEKEEVYMGRLSYARDRANGIEKPWERTAEPGSAGLKDLQDAKSTTNSLTTTNVKNVNDENLTKLNISESGFTGLKDSQDIKHPVSSIQDQGQKLNRSDLLKEGYVNIADTYHEEHTKYLKDWDKRGYYDSNGYAYTHPPTGSCYYCDMQALYNSFGKPIEVRKQVAAKAGYELHEQYPGWARKLRRA